jgi:hypothetical protein
MRSKRQRLQVEVVLPRGPAWYSELTEDEQFRLPRAAKLAALLHEHELPKPASINPLSAGGTLCCEQ